MSETEHGDNPNELLGYVVGDNPDDAEMKCDVCTDTLAEPHILARVHDTEVYGDRVPYPECATCGKVMRP